MIANPTSDMRPRAWTWRYRGADQHGSVRGGYRAFVLRRSEHDAHHTDHRHKAGEFVHYDWKVEKEIVSIAAVFVGGSPACVRRLYKSTSVLVSHKKWLYKTCLQHFNHDCWQSKRRLWRDFTSGAPV